MLGGVRDTVLVYVTDGKTENKLWLNTSIELCKCGVDASASCLLYYAKLNNFGCIFCWILFGGTEKRMGSSFHPICLLSISFSKKTDDKHLLQNAQLSLATCKLSLFSWIRCALYSGKSVSGKALVYIYIFPSELLYCTVLFWLSPLWPVGSRIWFTLAACVCSSIREIWFRKGATHILQ